MHGFSESKHVIDSAAESSAATARYHSPQPISDFMAAVAQFEQLSALIVDEFQNLSKELAQRAYPVLERVRKRLALVDAAYVVAMQHDLPLAERRRAAWLAETCRISKAEAKQRLAVVERLRAEAEPHSPPSQDLRMPTLREKVREGLIGADAVCRIDRAVRNLPSADHKALTELFDTKVSAIVEKVRVDDLSAVPQQMRAMAGLGSPYTDADRARRREVALSAQGPDGMSRLSGLVTPHLAAMLKRLFADHGRPGGLLPEGADDERSPGQRFHDALEAAVAKGFRPGAELQPARGTTSVVTVAHIADVAAMVGLELPEGKEFRLPGVQEVIGDTGVRLSVRDAFSRLIGRNSFLQILGDEGQTLFLGRSRRLGSMAQYLALLGEEGGSSAPGRATPAAMCDIHHVEAWGNGGKSDLPNLTFVDPGRHRDIDDERKRADAWWTMRPDECASTERAPDRVIWKCPDGKEDVSALQQNVDPGLYDNPGRWLRRIAHSARRSPSARPETKIGQEQVVQGNRNGKAGAKAVCEVQAGEPPGEHQLPAEQNILQLTMRDEGIQSPAERHRKPG